MRSPRSERPGTSIFKKREVKRQNNNINNNTSAQKRNYAHSHTHPTLFNLYKTF